ncbi:MAG: GAF domain-containing protein [Deltaproteobacteria bacterium]|nr:GAF domain-containing protein [Deltaproteobacteria bacterium]
MNLIIAMAEPMIDVSPLAPRAERYDYILRIAPEVLAPCPDLVAAMATAVSLLDQCFPEFFWIGFYRVTTPENLVIGPYRGTLGCVEIPFSRGVCGEAARTKTTVVVPDVNAHPGHIACDAAAKSEIVVPVMTPDGALVGVLDVDSDILDDFTAADATNLEAPGAARRRFGPISGFQ